MVVDVVNRQLSVALQPFRERIGEVLQVGRLIIRQSRHGSIEIPHSGDLPRNSS
ncbi:hypothetical protein ACFC1R_34950 [Kitasatospora sp. NPDC056138]|uniref:hypothetical protein n=1 Tax=Kitasatospora sp. NPDC056138 TaxID=3345724 RepID=UPI0035DA8F56